MPGRNEYRSYGLGLWRYTHSGLCKQPWVLVHPRHLALAATSDRRFQGRTWVQGATLHQHAWPLALASGATFARSVLIGLLPGVSVHDAAVASLKRLQQWQCLRRQPDGSLTTEVESHPQKCELQDCWMTCMPTWRWLRACTKPCVARWMPGPR